MHRHSSKLSLLLLFPLLLSCAFAGTYSADLSVNWNGEIRYYDLYLPTHMATRPALFVMLQATQVGAGIPPAMDRPALRALADKEGFIVLWPTASYVAGSNSWFWDAYFLDYAFAPGTDDSGYIRYLILAMEAAYPIDRGAVFVGGFSSGGFMAHRVGIDSADLVAAVGAVSGQLYTAKSVGVLPQPLLPVSLLIMNGDADPRVGYCGQQHNWGDSTSPSVDVTVDWWIAADACRQVSTTQLLCTSKEPTNGAMGLDATACAGGAEVLFVREVGVGHTWVPGTETVLWQFFDQHRRITSGTQ